MDKSIPKTIVIARYNESMDWYSSLANVVVVQKDRDLPNIGREPSSYVWYILNHWGTLNGIYFFLQGDPRDHCSDLYHRLMVNTPEFEWFSNRDNLECDLMGRPHDNVDIAEFLQRIGIEYTAPTIKFHGCCLFKVSTDTIKARPKEFYANLYDVLMEDKRWEYAFERCVGIIFNDNRPTNEDTGQEKGEV